MENVVEEKLSTDIYPIGSKAGEITEETAKLTGLKPGTAVAVGNVDARCSTSCWYYRCGKILMIIGTSTCHMLLGDEEKNGSGMCGVVEDGIIPGYLGYEAGQSCVGDHFQWFIENCVPAEYINEAEQRGISIHKVLREKASQLKPGQSGLVALDWWRQESFCFSRCGFNWYDNRVHSSY